MHATTTQMWLISGGLMCLWNVFMLESFILKKKYAFIVCLDLNQPGLYFCIVLLSTAEAWVGLDVSTAGVEVSAEETRN